MNRKAPRGVVLCAGFDPSTKVCEDGFIYVTKTSDSEGC